MEICFNYLLVQKKFILAAILLASGLAQADDGAVCEDRVFIQQGYSKTAWVKNDGKISVSDVNASIFKVIENPQRRLSGQCIDHGSLVGFLSGSNPDEWIKSVTFSSRCRGCEAEGGKLRYGGTPTSSTIQEVMFRIEKVNSVGGSRNIRFDELFYLVTQEVDAQGHFIDGWWLKISPGQNTIEYTADRGAATPFRFGRVDLPNKQSNQSTGSNSSITGPYICLGSDRDLLFSGCKGSYAYVCNSSDNSHQVEVSYLDYMVGDSPRTLTKVVTVSGNATIGNGAAEVGGTVYGNGRGYGSNSCGNRNHTISRIIR